MNVYVYVYVYVHLLKCPKTSGPLAPRCSSPGSVAEPEGTSLPGPGNPKSNPKLNPTVLKPWDIRHLHGPPRSVWNKQVLLKTKTLNCFPRCISETHSITYTPVPRSPSPRYQCEISCNLAALRRRGCYTVFHASSLKAV